jgi:TetR/AcrR family transcriptional regulator, cholesterol catabolism regulator
LKKELEMTAIFEKLLSQAVLQGELDLNEKEIQAAAHNILIIGQMWTFRRWALQKMYTLEEYTQLQLQQLFHGIKGA